LWLWLLKTATAITSNWKYDKKGVAVLISGMTTGIKLKLSWIAGCLSLSILRRFYFTENKFYYKHFIIIALKNKVQREMNSWISEYPTINNIEYHIFNLLSLVPTNHANYYGLFLSLMFAKNNIMLFKTRIVFKRGKGALAKLLFMMIFVHFKFELNIQTNFHSFWDLFIHLYYLSFKSNFFVILSLNYYGN